MLEDDVFMPIESPYASPVVLFHKNNGKSIDDPEAWRFAINYKKLNVNTLYAHYTIPVIDGILDNN